MRNYDGLWSRLAHEFPMVLHFHMHYFSPNQLIEHSHGGDTSQALCLIEHSQETASQLSAHKICPSKYKGVQVNLSLQAQHLKQLEGSLQAWECQRLRAKLGFSIDGKSELEHLLCGAGRGLHYWAGSEWTHTTARTRETPGGQGRASL